MDEKALQSLRLGNRILLGFIAVFALIVLRIILVFVPQTASVLTGLGSELPPLTAATLAFTPWGFILVFLAVLAGLIWIEVIDSSRFLALVTKIIGLFLIFTLGILVYSAMMLPVFRIVDMLARSG